jgi:hypothetical protein
VERRDLTMKAIVWVTLALLGASAALCQSHPAEASLAGCYAVTLGAWSQDLGGDSIFHRVPAVVRLDTAVSSGGRGRMLSPNIEYPRARPFPDMPRWELHGDTISLLWSNGFAPTLVRLHRAGARLIGEAVAESDVRGLGAPPRADATLQRVACAANGGA